MIQPILVEIFYFFENYEEEYESGTENLLKSVKYYFANGQRVAQRVSVQPSSDEVSYYHADHSRLGSAVRMTDADGNTIQSIAYFSLTLSSNPSETSSAFTTCTYFAYTPLR